MEGLEKDETGAMEDVTLQNDVGAPITFSGRLVAENSFFDETTGALTRQKLYHTADGAQAYSVATSDGKTKERRAYIIRREGALCRINNGLFDVTVNARDLLTAVKGLCGLGEAAKGEDFLDEKTAANG